MGNAEVLPRWHSDMLLERSEDKWDIWRDPDTGLVFVFSWKLECFVGPEFKDGELAAEWAKDNI